MRIIYKILIIFIFFLPPSFGEEDSKLNRKSNRYPVLVYGDVRNQRWVKENSANSLDEAIANAGGVYAKLESGEEITDLNKFIITVRFSISNKNKLNKADVVDELAGKNPKMRPIRKSGMYSKMKEIISMEKIIYIHVRLDPRK